MVADGLTKDQMDPADLLRAAVEVGEYQLNQEATILAIKKQQREEGKKRQTHAKKVVEPKNYMG